MQLSQVDPLCQGQCQHKDLRTTNNHHLGVVIQLRELFGKLQRILHGTDDTDAIGVVIRVAADHDVRPAR